MCNVGGTVVLIVLAQAKKSRLIVVANRLPISVSKDAAGAYQFKMSSGGLVSALVSVRYVSLNSVTRQHWD
jgi:trehalose-6-phosphate synthase